MIKLLLFAHLQEEIGQSELTIDVANLTVRELKNWINSTYTVSNMDHVMVAINEQYALDTEQIQAGDVIALIPPVSGG